MPTSGGPIATEISLAGPDAPPGLQKLLVEARYQSCNDRLCLPPKTVKLEASVEVL